MLPQSVKTNLIEVRNGLRWHEIALVVLVPRAIEVGSSDFDASAIGRDEPHRNPKRPSMARGWFLDLDATCRSPAVQACTRTDAAGFAMTTEFSVRIALCERSVDDDTSRCTKALRLNTTVGSRRMRHQCLRAIEVGSSDFDVIESGDAKHRGPKRTSMEQ